jgi:hypothetical protein
MRSSATLAALVMLSLAGAVRADVSQPTAIIDRPRTLPEQEFEASLLLGVGREGTTTTTGTTYATSTGIDVGIGYGFTRAFEARLSYGFGVDPTSRGPIGVAIGYALDRHGRFTSAFDAGVGYDLGPDHLAPLTLGFAAQGVLSPRVALFTPGHQLKIDLSGDNPAGIRLPIGLGYQANWHFWVDAQVELAYIPLHGGGGKAFGADYLPFRFDAIYAITNAFDLGLTFADDFKAAGDSYDIGGFVRIFL